MGSVWNGPLPWLNLVYKFFDQPTTTITFSHQDSDVDVDSPHPRPAPPATRTCTCWGWLCTLALIAVCSWTHSPSALPFSQHSPWLSHQRLDNDDGLFQVNWDGMAWGEIVCLICTLYRAQINESRSGLILTPPTGLSSPMIMGFRFFFGINKYPMTRRSLT